MKTGDRRWGEQALARFEGAAPGRGRTLGADHPAVLEARTLFPTTVLLAGEENVLKSGVHQRKIGRKVLGGQWKGMPIYCLSLEERATCPSSCDHWRSCYGNNMHYARRFSPGDELEVAIWCDLFRLEQKHPTGFVVRLHVLGDFYSIAYAEMWVKALDRIPALRVYGYTARHPWMDPIGAVLWSEAHARWDRFAIRFSGHDSPTMGAITIRSAEDTDEIVCPAQTNATENCGTCGFCWHSQRTVAFLHHGGAS